MQPMGLRHVPLSDLLFPLSAWYSRCCGRGAYAGYCYKNCDYVLRRSRAFLTNVAWLLKQPDVGNMQLINRGIIKE